MSWIGGLTVGIHFVFDKLSVGVGIIAFASIEGVVELALGALVGDVLVFDALVRFVGSRWIGGGAYDFYSHSSFAINFVCDVVL